MKFLRGALYCFSALLPFALGCSSQPSKPSPNAAMVEELRRIAEDSDPAKNTYLSRGRAELFRGQPIPAENTARISQQIRLAKELLQAGYNQEAIELFAAAAAEAPRYGIRTRPSLNNMLALAYQRLGEQQNCIERHHTESCLLPISATGVHTKQEGSRRAAELYGELLQKNPADLSVRWLLNIAYMTLGEYPDGVPANALIPPTAFAAEYDIGRFEDRAAALGVGVMGLAGGTVVEDFNNDGLLDIAASSWDLQGQLLLFFNEGNGKYIDVTERAGLTGLFGGLNLRQVDYDNDGLVDLFVLRGAWFGAEGLHPNSLLRNMGDGTFLDVTEKAGLLSHHPTQTAAWADFNNDGFVDLFIGNESTRGKMSPFLGDEGGRTSQHACELFLNRGDGTFLNVAALAGAAITGFVKGVSWGDYDNDGRIDLYISRLREANILLHNEGADSDGVPRFRDVTSKAGVAEPIYSFPTWFWDYDNDGYEDIFVAGYRAKSDDIAAEYLGKKHGGERPRLYRNNGDGTFSDVAGASGLDKILYSMGCNYGDLDNDGWLDFYVGTGDPDFRLLVPNRMFRNAAGHFQEVTTSGGFGHLQKGHGISFADVDNDGDQDVYAVMGGAYSGDIAANVLFENPGHGHHWIKLHLQGTQSNRMAVGARIVLALGDRKIYARISPGASFGANPYRCELGVGTAKKVDMLRIEWPSGQVQEFANIEVDRAYKIAEGGELTDWALQKVQLAKSGAHDH
jgi:tetratricopeptide (TPR) repeat protein